VSSPAVPYRLLPAAETLLGAAGSLENYLDPLKSGALCWVRDQGALYSFEKDSTAAVSAPSIIATARGAGVPGRWIRYVAASSTLPFTNAFWVDKGAIAGGNGSAAAPFNTVTDAVAACPTGGSILVLSGDYSAEPDVAVGSKSLTFQGFGGQEGAVGRVILPTIGYASGGTLQNLTFRHVQARVEATGASLTALYLDFCPFIELAGAGNASQIKAAGDATCALQGEGGLLFVLGGLVGPYTANANQAIVLEAVAIYGDLSTAGAVRLVESDWTGVAFQVTGSVIVWELTTAYAARQKSIVTSMTPIVVEAHNASDTFAGVTLAVGTSDVPIDVSTSMLAGINVGDAVVATWGAPGPSGFGNAAIGGCEVTALNEVTVRFVGVTGGGASDIILTWLQAP
jgi:hypothetical protein